MEKTTRRALHSRVPADLHQAVAEYAVRTHRTVNGAVIQLLELGLRAAERHEQEIKK